MWRIAPFADNVLQNGEIEKIEIFHNPSNVRISSCVARYHHEVISPPQAISLREAQYFPTFIKKSILKDSSWRAGAGILAHIRVHSRVARSLTHVIIQNMHFIYYITHKILKICKNIAYVCINIQNYIVQENRHNRIYVWTSYI